MPSRRLRADTLASPSPVASTTAEDLTSAITVCWTRRPSVSVLARVITAASLKLWEANVGAHELGMSLLKRGASCADVTHAVNGFFEDRDLLQYRSFGYGHSFGVLSHYYGREAGLELREDIDTILEPGMVISMEPMITIPDGQPGAGGYREHDILIITEDGNENITQYPYGPAFNVVGG